MKWHEDGYAIAADDIHDNAFWHADLTEAADHLVEVIREVRPQVLVTYDQFGGYGHPDHIQAHRVATYAAAAGRGAVVPPRPRRAVGHRQDLLGRDVGEPDAGEPASGCARPATPTTFEGMDPDGPLPPFVTADDNLTARVDGSEYLDTKMDALARHRTQIAIDGPFFARQQERPRDVGRGVLPDRQGHARTGRRRRLETDLFAGL